MVVGMSKRPLAYQSYLLRLWPVRDKGEAIWRASLESPHSGERYNFANLAELFAFLQRQAGQLTDKTENEKP